MLLLVLLVFLSTFFLARVFLLMLVLLLLLLMLSLVSRCAGKLCLRDKELAKSSVNILVRELDTAIDPAVRSNALVVLGDLCVRSGVVGSSFPVGEPRGEQ